MVDAGHGNVAARQLQQLQGAFGRFDGPGLKVSPGHVVEMVLHLNRKKASGGGYGERFRVASLVLADSKSLGLVAGHQEYFLEIDGCFAAGDSDFLNDNPSDTDAFHCEQAEGTVDVVLKGLVCCVGLVRHGFTSI